MGGGGVVTMEGLFDTMEGFSLLVSACLLSTMCGGKVSVVAGT